MKYTKDGVIEDLNESQIKKYEAYGWVPYIENIKAVEEIVRLKPTVKTRATVKAPDEANTIGDE